ncbi:MAG TPA: outer membrane beta-barrel protein [Candidatus Krumholzibacteria bacterium]|nr:outer membrane beta-barrel protein [Candidatus Krumholzibacteria bacterium]
MRRYALLLTFALCSLWCQSAVAQADIGLKGAGFAVGIVSPEDMDATFGVGAFLDLGSIVPNLHVEPRVDYWSKSEDFFSGSVSVRDIAIGARAKYYFPIPNPKLRPFAGGGLALNLLNVEVETVDPFTGGTMTGDDSSSKVGLDLGGGLATPLGPRTTFLTEVWYGIVSDFSHITLRVGLMQAFGP